MLKRYLRYPLNLKINLNLEKSEYRNVEMGKQATQKNILDECHLASPLNLNPEQHIYIEPILER